MTIAFAVVAGVHCSAPTSSSDATAATDEPAATQTEEPASPAPAPKSGDPSAPAQSDDGDWRWSIEAEGLPPTVFTSTVGGDDGAIYAAGTYAGSLEIGRGTVTSKGADDVVLARLDQNGHVAWVKSIGSTKQERAPKVTFVDGTVRIMAETEGEVDCGNGKMGRWSSEMFFYCLYSIDGEPLGGGTFPTGVP